MSESYSTIVSGEKSPIEQHHATLANLLQSASQFRELFSSDYSSLNRQEKNKIVNKMNKFIKKHHKISKLDCYPTKQVSSCSNPVADYNYSLNYCDW